MPRKRKADEKRGGVRHGAGAPKGQLHVDASSPLMRGLGEAIAASGEPSVYEIANATGVPFATVSHAIRHGRTPAAVRSIERILAGLGYAVSVVRIPKDPKAPGLDQ